jgi:hypothetical protein
MPRCGCIPCVDERHPQPNQPSHVRDDAPRMASGIRAGLCRRHRIRRWPSGAVRQAFASLLATECRDLEVSRTSLSGFTSPRLRGEVRERLRRASIFRGQCCRARQAYPIWGNLRRYGSAIAYKMRGRRDSCLSLPLWLQHPNDGSALPLPLGEGWGEGFGPIDRPLPLTRRYAPTSPSGRGR